MAIQAQPEAPTASPAPREQRTSTFLHVETMNDLDTGQPMLIGSTEPALGDLQVVTAAQVRKMTGKVRASASRAEALAAAFEASTTEPAQAHATWTATEIGTGQPLHFTCMTGCDTSHATDVDTPSFAPEVNCISHDRDNTGLLPVGCGDDADPGPVLSTIIQVDHFHPDPARRVPYAAVEVIEDHFIECRDPDGLAGLIDHFEQRVAAMRVRHAELVRTRNEYLGRQA